MTDNLTDMALEGFHRSGEEAAFLLHDGVRMTGKVVDFDGYIVVMSGTPDYVLYRHSILKLEPAHAAARAKTEITQGQKRRAQTQPKSKAPAPRRRTPRPETPAPAPASSESGFSNPMADAMQKWLKSQKGGG